MKITPEKILIAVTKLLEEEAFAAEQQFQNQRTFSKNERIAFRRGFYRGMAADAMRARNKIWELAADEIRKFPDTGKSS